MSYDQSRDNSIEFSMGRNKSPTRELSAIRNSHNEKLKVSW